MTIEPKYLRLEEAYQKSGTDDRDAFLSHLRDLLAAGDAEARGRPGQPHEPRTLVGVDEWRDLVLCFELDGCAAPAKHTERSLGAAYWRRTGHPNLKPFDPQKEPIVWLDLLISLNTNSFHKEPSSSKNPNRGGGYGSDTGLVERIRCLILDAEKKGRSMTPSKAASQVAPEAEGSSVPESICRRLVSKYKKKYPG